MFNRGVNLLINHTIMKSLKTMLPALGLVFGATLAMAMNVPTMVSEKTATTVWTPDSHPDYIPTNGYREITDLEEGDYECNGTGSECRVEFHNDNPNTGIKNVLDFGVLSVMP